MKSLITSLVNIPLVLFLLIVPAGLAQESPKTVSLVQLIANPEKYDSQLVTVKGYLARLGGHHDLTAHFLHISREDADNQLDNAILVLPSDEMRRNYEKIDHMYVTLVGVFHTVKASNNAVITEIKDVRSCTPWSDPAHPIGMKQR